MKYFAILIGLLIALQPEVNAQTAKDYFLNMPASFVPYLTKINKEDMPDFIESKMAAKVKNRFQSTTEMKQLYADYLEIETTSASTLQLKILPYKNGSHLLALVTTFNGPVPDSRIQFFTEDWKEIPARDFLTLPLPEHFLLPVGTPIPVDSTLLMDSISQPFKNKLEINPLSLLTPSVSSELHDYVAQRLEEIYLCSIRFVPGDSSLRLVYHTPDYMDERNRKLVRQCMKKEALVMQWQDGRFLLTD